MWDLFCFLLSLYKLTLNETDERINKVKINANKCGPLAIKLLQFMYMNNIIKTDKLKTFLENCDIHTSLCTCT